MRIIAGIAKGTPLLAPRDAGTRPTSDRVREAIFSSLGDRVLSATVVDLFAGTGALGLEAASRGAKSVTFVEQSRPVLLILEKNLAAAKRSAGLECEFAVCREDALRWMPAGGAVDLVFADPPYALDPLPVVQLAGRILAPGGVLILETARRTDFTAPSDWRQRKATYGDTLVSYLSRLGDG